MGALFKALPSPARACPNWPVFGAPLAATAPPSFASRHPSRSDATMIQSPELALPGLVHGFFTRQGGVSTGIYASLNGGLGSADERANVWRTAGAWPQRLGVAPAEARQRPPGSLRGGVAVTGRGRARSGPGRMAWRPHAWCRPGDFHRRLRTRALRGPWRGVIGACHSGWRGAFDGILEGTLAAMEELGAQRARVIAVLGPTISRAAYEEQD